MDDESFTADRLQSIKRCHCLLFYRSQFKPDRRPRLLLWTLRVNTIYNFEVKKINDAIVKPCYKPLRFDCYKPLRFDPSWKVKMWSAFIRSSLKWPRGWEFLYVYQLDTSTQRICSFENSSSTSYVTTAAEHGSVAFQASAVPSPTNSVIKLSQVMSIQWLGALRASVLRGMIRSFFFGGEKKKCWL